PGPPVVRFDWQPRLPGGGGDAAPRNARSDRRQLGCRHAVRQARPADPLRMTWAVRLGVLYVLLLVAFSLLGSRLAPYDPFALSQESLSSPTAAHPMGTDNIGRDIFSGVIYGTGPTLAVGFFTAIVAAMVGICVGAVSGYF